MITLSIDEKDPHVLRVSASYLLALASERQVTAEIANNVAHVHNSLIDNITGSAAPTFNEAELAESIQLATKQVQSTIESAVDRTFMQPDAATVFGKSQAVALSTVGAEASPTAPADTTETILTPTPPSVPSPPVASTVVPAPPAVAPTAPPAHNVEVDARGLPWDARIHSREKTKVSNGNWKNKRGVDPAVLESVEAELTRLMQIPTPLAPAAPVTAPPVIVPPPPVATHTATPANLSSNPFPALMQKLTSAITAKTLTNDQALAIAKQNGIESLPGLITRPDLIPQVEAAIDAQIALNIAGGA